MSLSWLDARRGIATVCLERNGVSLRQRRNGQLDVQVFEDTDGAGASGQAPWQPALRAFERMIESEAAMSGVKRIRLIVSNEFVRYVLVPWTEQQLTTAQREQLVRLLLAERYGERGQTWHVAIEPRRFETPALAAAIDAEFVSALRHLGEKHGRRLISMVPALIDRLNTHRQELRAAINGWLIDTRDGRLAGLAFCGGDWVQVTNERCPGRSGILEDDLSPLLRRDTLKLPDLLGGTVFVAERGELPGMIDQTWPVVSLQQSVVPSCA